MNESFDLHSLCKALPIISSLLKEMVEERNDEVSVIKAKIDAITAGEETADEIELATFGNHLLDIKYELIAIQKLSSKIESEHHKKCQAISIWSTTLSYPCRNALFHYGIRTLGDLENCTNEQVLSIRNIGKLRYKEIVDMLKEYGIKLKDDDHAATGGQ